MSPSGPAPSLPRAFAREGRLDVRPGFASAIGGRERNEDFAAFASPPPGEAHAGLVAAIADGVGGARGGRVAAELAVRGFIDGYFGQDGLQTVQRTSARSLEAIHRWIGAIGSADAALEGMACTFTALILRGRQAHLIHVGDSRLYRLRDNALVRLTTDHVARGGLTRAIGAPDHLRIDYAFEPARPHDRYLLCTDGVHGGLSEARIRAELARRAGPEETAHQLVEAALDARIGDNATALVLDMLDLPPADRADLALAIAEQPIVPPPRAGSSVDDFELRAMLADGRYSRVFAGFDRVGQRDVILKFPKPITGDDSVLRQAFLREAWIAARLRNPWIGEVIEVPGQRRTCLYTVMPHYHGETLEQRLVRSPAVTLAVGLAIAIKLAKAVAALHRAGVVHRDIKPENIILEAGDSPRLVDLGVARLPNMEDASGAETPGTPSYMAPELLAGGSGDEQSDLFATGVTIYRMFARTYPYGEIEPFSRPRFGRPASLLTQRPDLPAWLDHVLARAVAARTEDRFEDLVELVFALESGATAAAAAPAQVSFYGRDPLRFWQAVSALLSLLLIGKCALG